MARDNGGGPDVAIVGRDMELNRGLDVTDEVNGVSKFGLKWNIVGFRSDSGVGPKNNP